MDDALKTRGIIYLNVETWLLFVPPPSKSLAMRLVGVYSAEAGAESESKISNSVHLWQLHFTSGCELR